MIVRRRPSEIARGHLIPKPLGRGLGAVIQYYEMPDAETQRIIAERGDTIQIIPRPSSSGPSEPTEPVPFSFVDSPTSQMFWQETPVAMNPQQFATKETADAVAAIVGGEVVETKLAGGSTSAPMYDIAVPGSTELLNAGLVADLFNKYGIDNPLVWDIINRDLGYYSSPSQVPPVAALIDSPDLRVGPSEQPYVQPPAPKPSQSGTAQTTSTSAAAQAAQAAAAAQQAAPAAGLNLDMTTMAAIAAAAVLLVVMRS